MRISDWSSDVCSSDLVALDKDRQQRLDHPIGALRIGVLVGDRKDVLAVGRDDRATFKPGEHPLHLGIALRRQVVIGLARHLHQVRPAQQCLLHELDLGVQVALDRDAAQQRLRSEEPTSELQSLMRNSYAVFCLKKKKERTNWTQTRMKPN